MAQPLQGVTQRQEIRRTRLLRDTRRLSEQLLDMFSSFEALCIVAGLMCLLVVIMPASFDWMLVLALGYGPIALRRKPDIPFRKRAGLKELDLNDRNPGNGKPQMARGIGFIGNRKEDNMEIWAANEDLRTHMFVLGSTGAGKTEGLTSLAVNALSWGSGFSYIDGKGDVTLWAKIFRMVRQFGREDDLLVINYMTGNANTKQKRADKLSNTYNPFTVGNAESLIQLLVSLMDASDGKGDMWKGRAISFISSLMPALVELRDQGRLMLYIGAIRNFMPFTSYGELMKNPHISEDSRSLMLKFLLDVPGFNKDKFDKEQPQASTVLEQYGYQQMQFTRVLSSLADTYGHIYNTPQGEVNLKDVTTSRRILLVLLPALEKSRPELANLGKIIVAGMKGMMGGQLGNKLEGSKRELLDSRATKAPTPFIAIFDEFGYFMPEDAALMWAQARSLGFMLVAAGQDLQAFYRTSKEETLAIYSNSNIKMYGKIEDPTDTFDLLLKRAGEAWVSELDAYEMDTENMAGGYKAGTGARHTKVNRIDLRDLVEQIEGEVHIIVSGNLIRARVFYAVPDEVADYKLNHFLRVEPPAEADIKDLLIDTTALAEALRRYPLARGEDDTLVDDRDRDMAIEGAGVALATRNAQSRLQARQGAELGIVLFLSAVDGLDREAPVTGGDAEGGGGRGGYVHTPEPSAPAPDEDTDDVVFDGAALDGVSVFGPIASGADGLDAEEMALFGLAAEAMVYSASGTTPRDRETLGFLDGPECAIALRGIAAALGATPSQAVDVARTLIEAATEGTRYPMPPKPERSPEVSERFNECLTDMEQWLSPTDTGASR